MASQAPRLEPGALRGRNLRYCLLTLLHDAGRPLSIGELLDALQLRGLRVAGRDPRKTVGDVLRYESSLGRVRRVGWGRYEATPRPPTTVRRHRGRLEALVREAARRGGPTRRPTR